MNKEYKLVLRTFVILILFSLLVFLLGLNSGLVERFYASGLYQFTSVSQRFISGIFPFPLGDFLYLLLIVYAIWRIVTFSKKVIRRSLKKSDRIKIPLQLINFTLLLYLTFKLLWGLNYSRPVIAAQLGLKDEMYTTDQLVQLGRFFIGRLNDHQNVSKKRYTIKELQEKATLGYDSLAKKNALFTYKSPAVKPVLNSWAITKIGIEGYYNPISGEANVNMRLPDVALPFVACHEIAHQIGIGREDEANLVGYLAARNSNDEYFQYCADYAMLRSILFEIRLKSPEDYKLIYETINPGTVSDFKKDRAFWKAYNNDMFGYLDVAFDKFLKLNNQKKGTDSYQDIVLWLYNLHKQDLINNIPK